MTEAVRCPSCGRDAPRTEFCAGCGAALPAPTALAVEVLPIAVRGPTTTRHRLESRTVGILAVVVVTLAAGAWLMLGRATKHDVTGDLTLTDSTSTTDLSPGDACSGSGGYGDMTEGAQVVLEDGQGSTLATSALGSGRYDGTARVFSFSLTGAAKATFYVLKVGNSRGDMHYSYDEMVGNDWSVHLTLGE